MQEHTAKVVERDCWLIGKHGLEKVVDRLIPGIAGKYSENVQEELKRMFMAVVKLPRLQIPDFISIMAEKETRMCSSRI